MTWACSISLGSGIKSQTKKRKRRSCATTLRRRQYIEKSKHGQKRPKVRQFRAKWLPRECTTFLMKRWTISRICTLLIHQINSKNRMMNSTIWMRSQLASALEGAGQDRSRLPRNLSTMLYTWLLTPKKMIMIKAWTRHQSQPIRLLSCSR